MDRNKIHINKYTTYVHKPKRLKPFLSNNNME